MERKKIYLKILVNFILSLIGILLLIFLLPKLLRFFLPFVIALIISAIANPLVQFMQKKIKIKRKHSSVIIIIVVLAAVVGILYALGALTVKQAINLYEDRFALYDSFTSAMADMAVRLAKVGAIMPEDVQKFWSGLQTDLGKTVTGFLEGVTLPSISTAGSYVKSVAETILLSIITILAAYFMIAERDELVATLEKIMPKSVLNLYNLIVSNFKRAVGGYFKAQFKIMIILTIIMFIGFEILDIDFSFLLAFLIAFLDFLPVFGTGAVFWPWIVVDVVSANYTRAIFLGVMYLICQLVKQILQPKMVGDSVGINPLETLFFMFVGYRIAGVLGMIIGIPIGMIMISFYQAGAFDRLIRGAKMIIKDINEFRKY